MTVQWIDFPDPTGGSAWHSDADNIDAATMIDSFRNNTKVLLQESPASIGGPIGNGQRTTAATAYGDSSALWLFTDVYVRGSEFGGVRKFSFASWVSISGGATGKLRFYVAGSHAIPGVTPITGLQATTESSTFTSATGVAKTGTVTVSLRATGTSDTGAGDSSYALQYFVVHLGVQGIVTSGSGTITIMDAAWEEVS